MRPIFDKVKTLAGGRLSGRALRNGLVGVSAAALAFGGIGALSAGQSSAAARIDASGPDTTVLDRGQQISRDVVRPEASPEELAAARTKALEADAADLALAQRQDSLDQRTSGLSDAAVQIGRESKVLLTRGVFVRPTAGKLGSPYGMRLHPILHYYRLHDGMDIGGNCGQPIVAASEGVVVKAAMGGYNGGSGNNVRIDDGQINGKAVETAYLHMQTIVVSVGQQVQKGDLLGTVGSTGLSTACHLHFSVYEDGRGVNPAKYLKL